MYIGPHTCMSGYVSAYHGVGKLCILLHTILCHAVHSAVSIVALPRVRPLVPRLLFIHRRKCTEHMLDGSKFSDVFHTSI